MKLIVLLFAACLGSSFALDNALSSVDYKQEVIYVNQNGTQVLSPEDHAQSETLASYAQIASL
ncbi:hypothetical protein [Rufibacter sp. DG15C]|jgi:hypothetical protein|uniref:hypothetical protein n=1 Tax=Rufibacter sp. DG15C TaxID=1379909 RepID=UPI000A87DAEA|nr:hypothetical protein [Rufibacter sp. DG15C]